MAIGLNISDALNGVTTLGSVSVHAPQVANQHYAHTVLRSRGTGNRPYDYLRLCEVRQAVPQRNPYMGVRTCGLPGAPPCMTGGAQTALSGVDGFFSTLWEQLKAGPPGWRTTPEERDAYEKTVRELPEDVSDKVTGAAKILNVITKPWFLGVAGGVVVLFVAAPYVVPFLRRR